MNQTNNEIAKECFQESTNVKKEILESGEYKKIVSMADSIANSIQNGNKLLICGNGGSAADAQHLAAELLIRLKPKNNREGIPAIALAMDSSTITACGNDFGYEVLFERMVETLGSEGDVLLGITTSGNSENVNRALTVARKNKILCLGFLGSGGGSSTELCDEFFLVPSDDTARIQESHITAGHILMELIENILIENKFITLR
jgi:D-sedoheptulose 7-phosphate isomerase